MSGEAPNPTEWHPLSFFKDGDVLAGAITLTLIHEMGDTSGVWMKNEDTTNITTVFLCLCSPIIADDDQIHGRHTVCG